MFVRFWASCTSFFSLHTAFVDSHFIVVFNLIITYGRRRCREMDWFIYSEAAIFVHATFRYVYDDGIIDPRDTRDVLAQCISVSLNAPYPPSTYGVFRM